MSWIAAGVSLGTAAIGFFKGRKQKREGQALLKQTEGREIPEAALENKRIATQMSQEGMPSQQYELAKRNIDRNNVSAILASNNRRGGLGLIPRILAGTNDAYLRLDANNANIQNQNKRTLMGVNSQIGGYQNQKYQGDYNYAQSLIGAGNDNQNNALDTAISGVGGGISDYLRNAKLSNGLYAGSRDRNFGSARRPSTANLTGGIDTGRAAGGYRGLF